MTPRPDLGQCNCCNNEPAVGVASSTLGPMSIEWGRECLSRGAEPWDFITALAEGAPSMDNIFAEWVLGIQTYKDGRYMAIREAIAGVAGSH